MTTGGGSYTPRTGTFPDEILLRHARAASIEAPQTARLPHDLNNNKTIQSCETCPVHRPAADLQARQLPNSSDPSGDPIQIPPGSVPEEIVKCRLQLELMQESFLHERKTLLNRIRELESDLETVNYVRQDEEGYQTYTFRELNLNLSQELTKALLKNAVLV